MAPFYALSLMAVYTITNALPVIPFIPSHLF